MKKKLFCALIGIGFGMSAFSVVFDPEDHCSVQYAICQTQDNMPDACEMAYLACKGLD